MCEISHIWTCGKCVQFPCMCDPCIKMCAKVWMCVWNMCDVWTSVAARVCLQKDCKMCVQRCEYANFCTPAHLQNVSNVRAGVAADVFFGKDMQKYVQKCERAKFRTSARPHACKVCAMCMQVWWAELFWKFLKKCVQKCECAKFRTSARVRSVCDVRASVSGVNLIFLKKMCAKVRMCEISHIRTLARVRNVRNLWGGASGGKRVCVGAT